MPLFRTIAVATDLSDASAPALRLATRLASEQHARLVLVHVLEIPSYVYAGVMQSPVDLVGPIEDAAKAELHEVFTRTKAEHSDTKSVLRRGVPSEQLLLAAAEEGADLIVVGTHGRTGATRLLLGSVAEKVVRLSNVPVVTVPSRASK